MVDEEFDDLLAGVDLLEDSSQESLTSTAANLAVCDSRSCDDEVKNCPKFPSSNADTNNGLESEVPNAEEHNIFSAGRLKSEETEQALLLENSSKIAVMAKIEKVFEGITGALQDKKDDLAINLKMRRSRANKATSSADGPISEPVVPKLRHICFPGKTAEDAWRFTVVIRILDMMHEALHNDVVLSKRDIYYRDPALFGKQSRVDRYVDDIAFTFGVPRSLLNVTAVAKGLIAGAARFCRRDGSFVNVAGDREGILVPSLRDVLSVDMAAVKWILVVEKEASFRSISASSFWDTISRDGIIVTAKGYPDIATRRLLHFLSIPSPQNGFTAPQVFGLVDFDPDGLEIVSVYKQGALALSHENDELCVPQMQWLGLHLDHVKMDEVDLHTAQNLLNLTARDRKKAVKMLERSNNCEDEFNSLQLREALQMMLVLNIKAELQLLDTQPCGMPTLLNSKLGAI